MSMQMTRFEKLERKLGEVVANYLKHEAYKEAEAAVEADDDVQGPITELNQLREEFGVPRQMGEATQKGLRKVQAAQEELHSEPMIEGYFLTQAELVDELEKINEAISEPLTADFGGETGGYCDD